MFEYDMVHTVDCTTEHMMSRNERVKVDCGTNAGSQVPVAVFFSMFSTVRSLSRIGQHRNLPNESQAMADTFIQYSAVVSFISQDPAVTIF